MGKKIIAVVFILSMIPILGGCSAGGLYLNIEPDPITYTVTQSSQEIILEVTTRGMGQISLDKFLVEIIDNQNEVIFTKQKEIDINNQFILPGITHQEKYLLDIKEVFSDYYEGQEGYELFYNQILKGRQYELRVSVIGSIQSSTKADVIFE